MSALAISTKKQRYDELPLADVRIPRLESGDRLSRAEFLRRYQFSLEDEKAELIKGVVYVASPVYLSHGEHHAWIMGWLAYYLAGTPGVRLADNTTTDVDPDAVVQPDASLWIEEKSGGRVRVVEKEPLRGAPELVVEIATSSASYDLHDKLEVYQRAGVQEYLVLQIYEQKTDWHGGNILEFWGLGGMYIPPRPQNSGFPPSTA